MSGTELPAGLKARHLASVSREPAPSSAGFVARSAAFALLMTSWLALSLVVAGVRPDFRELPTHYSVGTLLFVGASAAVLTGLALSRGKAMLGVRFEWLLAAVVSLPLAQGLWASVVVAQATSSYPCATAREALALTPPCLLMSLGLALPLSASLLWFRRRVMGGSPALTGAIIGAAAASLTHLVMHAHCPVANGTHALVGHALPILPVAALSALAASRIR